MPRTYSRCCKLCSENSSGVSAILPPALLPPALLILQSGGTLWKSRHNLQVPKYNFSHNLQVRGILSLGSGDWLLQVNFSLVGNVLFFLISLVWFHWPLFLSQRILSDRRVWWSSQVPADKIFIQPCFLLFCHSYTIWITSVGHYKELPANRAKWRSFNIIANLDKGQFCHKGIG